MKVEVMVTNLDICVGTRSFRNSTRTFSTYIANWIEDISIEVLCLCIDMSSDNARLFSEVSK